MNLRRASAAATVAVFALVACAQANDVVAPGLAVRSAAQSTFAEEGGRFTLSLVGDETDMAALFEATAGAGGVPEDDEDRELLEMLASSHVAISVDDGDRFALEVDLGDVDRAVEIRVVDTVLYARADVNGLMALFGADPATVSEMVAGAGEAGIGFLGDAVAGRWLAIDFGPREQDESASGDSPLPLSPEGFSAFLEAVSETFGEEVAVERLDEEEAGRHYRLSVPMRRVYERLVPVLGSLVPAPGGATPPPAAEIPDRSVSLDLWISDDRIRRAELDLGQFAEEVPAGRVALRVDVAGLDGAIEAPSDAVPVDIMEVMGQFLAGFGTALESELGVTPGP